MCKTVHCQSTSSSSAIVSPSTRKTLPIAVIKMPHSPLTPEEPPGNHAGGSSFHLAADRQGSGINGKLKRSVLEPSPASTYGGTAAGDSVPVTPQEYGSHGELLFLLFDSHITPPELLIWLLLPVPSFLPQPSLFPSLPSSAGSKLGRPYCRQSMLFKSAYLAVQFHLSIALSSEMFKLWRHPCLCIASMSLYRIHVSVLHPCLCVSWSSSLDSIRHCPTLFLLTQTLETSTKLYSVVLNLPSL